MNESHIYIYKVDIFNIDQNIENNVEVITKNYSDHWFHSFTYLSRKLLDKMIKEQNYNFVEDDEDYYKIEPACIFKYPSDITSTNLEKYLFTVFIFLIINLHLRVILKM